jgi:hypothetical protein
MSGHHCHAFGCTTPCRPTLLMCARHWSMVPKDIQAEVYSTYKKGQCDTKTPSRDWIKASLKARLSVAQQEKHENGINYCTSMLKTMEQAA